MDDTQPAEPASHSISEPADPWWVRIPVELFIGNFLGATLAILGFHALTADRPAPADNIATAAGACQHTQRVINLPQHPTSIGVDVASLCAGSTVQVRLPSGTLLDTGTFPITQMPGGTFTCAHNPDGGPDTVTVTIGTDQQTRTGSDVVTVHLNTR